MTIALGIVTGYLLCRIIATASSECGLFGRDDTDGPKKRSGLLLYVDRRTGVHYVRADAFSGLTPRLDRDGRIICEPVECGNHETPSPKPSEPSSPSA
jgi:hypothetical protein